MKRALQTFALFAVSFAARAQDGYGPIQFVGRWFAPPRQTIYVDQRNEMLQCESGVDARFSWNETQFNIEQFSYDCGPAPGGDRAVPYFMIGWQPLAIRDGKLYRNNVEVGTIDDNSVRFTISATEGSVTITHKISMWFEGHNHRTMNFEHLTSTQGQDVRQLRAALTKI